VLWEQSTFLNTPATVQDSQPLTLGAFEKHAKCVEVSQKKAEEEAAVWTSWGTTKAYAVTTGGWRMALGYKTTGAMRVITYNCLPDTVDPRGPKGK